ncbi:hypothetical protein KB681_gp43 [Burkholderia phage Mica]|uniref:Uncharacterized protein n=1 Tax=Burkholderia phage Mica TaxID=2767579 RepID=A0A873WBM8_9CAUD|nr:hypothetical protein KB681_gp43 [Burkholderia phage Mica]QPB08669.1 hypothetical protein CPT_Mica_057 [Burkholderia phage Mica]
MNRPNEQMVTLYDGTQVSNYSEEWRHETEARAILAMPSKRARQDFLYGRWDQNWKKERGGVLQIRGEAAVKRLEETILAIWEQRKQSAA